MGGGAMLYTLLPPKNPSAGLPSPSPSSSSSPSPNPNPVFPVPASYSASCSTCQGSVVNGGGGLQSSSTSAFGPVPSQVEIERAIAALQFFLQGISSSGSEMNWNWMELLGCCDPRMLISAGLGRVTRAFLLLQTDPSVERLVTSLASDRALWEAIMNNESVRKLGQSLLSAENGRTRIHEEAAAEPEYSGSDNLQWFLDILKERIMELIEKFKSLVNEIFQQYSDSMKQARAGETPAQVEEKVRSSLLLSVVVLLIVVLARVPGA